ncbi:DUF4393 domain-containing protein [Acinetobacter bereziniae]|uniref:DUF4393 domain-containing protein n=1 Tax=Acinetobacter bereziniae TaxID=106648 RepID=UPI0021E44A8C|nr:DUF4393 domain-containing protein [Acinetobacter bereziniae]MCV2441914.1 DUF4393 domain-containing protein [Acinetobacter bereziniae]
MEIKDLSGLGSYAPIIHELYKDMAQPAARNVGLALGAITSVGLFLHLLTSWGTDRLNICLKNNLEQYADRMKDVALEDVIVAPPEIAVPIIEKLSYVTNEDLRSLYIELLAKASIKEENDKAHPNFINIINSLSPDEASLLKYFKENPNIVPRYLFRRGIRKSDAFEGYLRYEYGNFIKLQFPENLSGYLENFEGLGIIYMTESNTAILETFQELERSLNYQFRMSNLNFNQLSLISQLGNVQKQSLYVTNYGKLFLDAVIGDDSIQSEK